MSVHGNWNYKGKGIPEAGVAQAGASACWIKLPLLKAPINVKFDSFVMTFTLIWSEL